MKEIEEFIKKDGKLYIVLFENKTIKEYTTKAFKNSIIQTINFMITKKEDFINKKLDSGVLEKTLLFQVDGKEKEIKKEFKIERFPCLMEIENKELTNFTSNLIHFKIS